jgi:hypothetical protein
MRQALWKKATTQHLIRRLQGDWIFVAPGTVVRTPLDLFACFVQRQDSQWGGGYYVHVLVNALYEPAGARWSWDIGMRWLDDQNQLWRNFPTPDDGEPDMARMAKRLNTEGAAFFEQHATLDGFRRACASYNRSNSPDGIGNPWMLRREAFTEILLGRYEEAIDSFTLVTRSAERYTGDWLMSLAAEANQYLARLATDRDNVRDDVLAGITTRKAELKLPAG